MLQNQNATFFNNFDESEYHVRLGGLDTFEDVVEFFRAVGNGSVVKFVRCQSVKDCGVDGDPYELMVIKPAFVEEIPVPFLIVSPTSVVRVSPGNRSEISSLSDFIHESRCFRAMKGITFFKSFARRKMLSSLASRARSRRFDKRRQTLEGGLLFARPPFTVCLSKVRDQCGSIMNIAMMEQCSEPMEMSEFILFLQDCVNRGAQSLDLCQSRILGAIAEVEKVIDNACADDRKSQLRQLKQKRIDSKTLSGYETNKRNLESLISLKRLVAFMTFEAVYQCLSHNSARFDNILSSKTSSIKISLNLSHSDIDLSPRIDEVESTLRELWKYTLGRIRVITNHIYDSLALPPAEIVDWSPNIECIRKQYDDFPLTAFYTLIPVQALCDQNTGDASDFEELCELLSIVQAHKSILAHTLFRIQSGIFSIDACKIRDDLASRLEDVATRCAANLSRIVSLEIRVTLEEANACIKTIETPPTTFNQYIQRITELSSATLRLHELVSRKKESVRKLEVASTYGNKASKDDAFNLALLETRLKELGETCICKALQEVELNRSWLESELRESAFNLSTEATSASREIAAALEPKEVWENVAARLQDVTKIWMPRATIMKQKLSEIQLHSVTLGIELADAAAVHEFMTSLDVKSKLIEYMSEFQDMQQRVMAAECQRIALDSFDNFFAWVDQRHSISMEMTPIEAKFLSAIGEWREIKLPIIRALRDPAIGPNHWDRIRGELGIKTFPASLGTLEEKGLFSKTAFIESLLCDARMEASIKARTTQLLEKWRSTCISVDNETGALWALSDHNRSIISQLQADLRWIDGQSDAHMTETSDYLRLRDAEDILNQIVSIQDRIDPNLEHSSVEFKVMLELQPSALASDRRIMTWFEAIPHIFSALAECHSV